MQCHSYVHVFRDDHLGTGELLRGLASPPESCGDYRVAPRLFCAMMGMEPRALCTLSKQSITKPDGALRIELCCSTEHQRPHTQAAQVAHAYNPSIREANSRDGNNKINNQAVR